MKTNLSVSVKPNDVSDKEAGVLGKDFGMYLDAIKPIMSDFEVDYIESGMIESLKVLEEAVNLKRAASGYKSATAEMKLYSYQQMLCRLVDETGIYDAEMTEYLGNIARSYTSNDSYRGWVLLAWYWYVKSIRNCKTKWRHPVAETYFTVLLVHGFFPEDKLEVLHADFKAFNYWMHRSAVSTPNRATQYLSKSKKFISGTWLINC
ncbi:hypothetical protein [Cohnella abietis]|uniref:Uncharacterized protein n=1 Tax=Cohnella abietis TaxID=2507935 RepID=A0A3T1CY25_9BACL|nr:hypothetical protein [Cohnella abietis]BBI30734.1 hypothetical protein KCTCHS21_01330 [Cohnella abietis]